MKRRMTALVGVAAAAMAMSACGTSGGGDDTEKTLVVGVDLPMQQVSSKAPVVTANAIKLYMEQLGGKVGKYKVELKMYDNSTAAKGSWDEATCKKNAAEHLANANEVAVVGPTNSGCSKAEVPILNQDPGGPMAIVSHASTSPGLTKAWDKGEPEVYYPTGKRNFARVITPDDYQGSAAAQFAAKDLGVKKCLVLNDGQTYGQGVAKSFAAEATKQGIAVVEQAWDPKQPAYGTLLSAAKAGAPDCVYLGGIVANNGIQLVKDKVKVLGDNTAVKLLAPDGFSGAADLQKLPEAQGMHLTYAGLALAQQRTSDTAAKFMAAYKAKYGADVESNGALYGVLALQVVLQAIERSDGTRKGVLEAIFSGSGVTVPAATAILGKDVTVDSKTGDVNTRDISVLLLKDNRENFLKAWPVA